MRILKSVVYLCFITIIALIFLIHIQLPEVKGYQHEISSTFPLYIGWAPFDVASSSFYYMLKQPTITSGLLVFMYFVGVGVMSYIGFILGLFVAIIERGKEANFIFTLSFTGCLFFVIFTTVIAILF